MTPVGFEPAQLVLVELESTPLDHSGKVSLPFTGPLLGILAEAWRGRTCLQHPVGGVPVPVWPSPLRSYTFRYTFLYVPDALSTVPLLDGLPKHTP